MSKCAVGDTLAVDAQLQVGEIGECIEVTAQTSSCLETETSRKWCCCGRGNFSYYKMPLYQRYINSTLNPECRQVVMPTAVTSELISWQGSAMGQSVIFEVFVVGNDQLSGTGTIEAH